ncbi:MAG: OsmC family protein [Gemmatimonadales bacterium]
MSDDPTRRAELRWEGGMRFRGGELGGPQTLLDADGVEAPGPFIALLLAVGACAASDVVSILGKMRVDLAEARVEVVALRRDEHPRRLVALRLVFRLRGADLTEANAARAVDLSLTKYCSVLASLAPDAAITHAIQLV